jgi:hypothetical protein
LNKDIVAKFFQWGLNGENLLFAKYRFNQPFHLIGADNFLKDLFNDKTILSSFNPVSYTLNCSGVKYRKLNSNVINMSFFDILKEKKVVMDNWHIKADFDEFYEGIQLSNRLRKAMLWEEDERYCELQDDKLKNEFIYNLF